MEPCLLTYKFRHWCYSGFSIIYMVYKMESRSEYNK